MKITAVLFFLLFISSLSFSQIDFDVKLKEISNDIAVKLNNKNKNKIVVLYITDIDNKKTSAGKYIADVVSYNIINNALAFQVFDRENLSEIIEVKRLIDEGYIDAAKAKELGQILAVEAIIIGNYTVLSSTLKLSLKALDVNSGLVVAASMKDLPLNEDAGALLGINISSNDGGSQGNRGFNSPIKSGENYNNPGTVNNDCETNNTGDYCFENTTQYEVAITLYGGTIVQYGREARERFSITLGPKQTECFFSLKAMPMEYSLVAKVNNGWTSTIIFSRKGNIKVEKCKSKTFNVQ
jgi:hypothetical protein